MGYHNLKERIKSNEGFSSKPYKDQLGYLTIGYGHLILPNENILLKKQIHKKELEEIFEKDFNKALSKFNNTFKSFTLNEKESNGKKLGFIVQEIGREINTLGSKANHFEIQKNVVQMKDHLEKIKEQTLNVL